jgi:DNA-binding transcriptional regulator YdaS (Cro superfamily)
MRTMAKRLGRSPSSVSREIARHGVRSAYRAYFIERDRSFQRGVTEVDPDEARWVDSTSVAQAAHAAVRVEGGVS